MKCLHNTKLLFSCFGLFLSLASAAGNSEYVTLGSVEGTVLDGESGDGLESATVALYNSADSSLLTGTITNHDGSMLLDFGDGTCDNTATVTKDGVTEEIDLTRCKFRGRSKKQDRQ